MRINKARTQLRIRALDLMMHNLVHSEERTQEIDVKFVRTRKIDYLDTFMKLDRQYKIEKSSQYPIHRQLQELQNKVVEQEEETISCENKCRLLGNHLVKINEEIECIAVTSLQWDFVGPFSSPIERLRHCNGGVSVHGERQE